MLINEKYFENIFGYLINERIIPFIEGHFQNVMKLISFDGYYKEEVGLDGNYIRPIFDLSQLDLVLIGIMINELEKDDVKNKFLKQEDNFFSYDTFFPWINEYMKRKFILCYIYPNDNEEYVFFARFQLDFVKITSILSQYIF